MKSRRFDGHDTRKVAAAMATDDSVLSRIASRWPTTGGLFGTPWVDRVGRWCVDYFKQYGQAPNGNLASIYQAWAATARNDEEAAAIETFLTAVSKEHAAETRPADAVYVLDVAENLFRRVAIKAAIDQAQIELDSGNIDAADAAIRETPVSVLPATQFVNPCEDVSFWEEGYDQAKRQSLVLYKGAIGKFYEEAFCRGEFYSFMGPDKSGKSYHVQDVSFRGLENQKRVAYFELGDLGRADCANRIGQRVTETPEWETECAFPTSLPEGTGDAVYETKNLLPSDPVDAMSAMRKLCRGRDLLRIVPMPIDTLSAAGVGSILEEWKRSGWTADIVAVDYADILAPPNGVKEVNEQIDETWKTLRRIAQVLDCCVVTATQSSALAYGDGSGWQSRKHFAGRKTKLAHVTGMIGINMTEDERVAGIQRLNWVVRRRRKKGSPNRVRIAGCIEVARPIIVSAFV